MPYKGSRQISSWVQAAPFPIYGLVGNPSEFAVCSFGWGRSNGQHTSVGFIFSSPRYPQERDAFDIRSSDAKQMGIVYNPEYSSDNPPFALEVFERYQLSEETRTQAGAPQKEEVRIVLDNTSFLGEIVHWSQPCHPNLVGDRVTPIWITLAAQPSEL